MSSTTTKEARRDAQEFARAQMFYGEGAGTRRKLITATVDSKISRDATYGRLFYTELAKQDMAEHAQKARKERRRVDAIDSTKRNTKAIVSGNYQNAQFGVLVILGIGYVAHKTGLDKVAYEKSKETYWKLRRKWAVRKILRETKGK